jgi:hypothetical protein
VPVLLTNEQREKLDLWISQKVKKCSVCAGNAFRFSGIGAIPPVAKEQEGNIVVAMVVPVTCLSCGNVLFVDTVQVGLLKAEPVSAPPQRPPPGSA